MKHQKGFGLIEVLLVSMFIGLLVILIAGIPNSLLLVGQSRYLNLAREIASKTIEDTRLLDYDNLVNTEENIIDTRISLLPGGAGTKKIENCDANICANGEHLKKLTVQISWKENNKDQQISIVTMVSDNKL